MRQKIMRIAAGCAGMILVLLAITWIVGGYAGMSIAGDIALSLGITVTVGLGIALMSLIFYSSRSERDESVYHPFGDERRM